MNGVPFSVSSIVASTFAEATRYAGESFPNADTTRGLSWFDRNTVFQP